MVFCKKEVIRRVRGRKSAKSEMREFYRINDMNKKEWGTETET